VADRPPYNNWLPGLHRALLAGIAQQLKAEYEPPTDQTLELADLLRRLGRCSAAINRKSTDERNQQLALPLTAGHEETNHG
jgi:hypothetical protein